VIDEGQWHKATKTPKQKKTPETTERWSDFSGVVSGEDGSGAPLQRSHFNHQKGRFNGSLSWVAQNPTANSKSLRKNSANGFPVLSVDRNFYVGRI
jgi:hypothetical protein